jgi:hypothetical protein
VLAVDVIFARFRYSLSVVRFAVPLRGRSVSLTAVSRAPIRIVIVEWPQRLPS